MMESMLNTLNCANIANVSFEHVPVSFIVFTLVLWYSCRMQRLMTSLLE